MLKTRTITLPIREQWDCHNCGNCCRGTVVTLTDADLSRLREQNWDADPRLAGTPITEPVRGRSDALQLAHRQDGSCVFLEADGLCRIHSKHGFDAKPEHCRTYPFYFVPQGERLVMTVRRSCPSAAQDMGRPIEQHLDALRFGDTAFEYSHLAPPLVAGGPRDWASVRTVGRALADVIDHVDISLTDRFTQALALCDRIEREWCREDTQRQPGFDAWIDSARQQLIVCEARGVQPTRSGLMARTLLRQVAFQYLRLHPQVRMAKGWNGAVRGLWVSARVGIGWPALPSRLSKLPRIRLARLEQAQQPIDPEHQHIIERYYRTTVRTLLYTSSARAGWPMLDAFRALALTYPALCWLLRWHALDRQVTREEVVNLISAIARSSGNPDLAKPRHLRTVRFLAEQNMLAELVRWYGR